MIYFTSDLHFYHPNIINLCKRPFENYEQMHGTLIENWNRTIEPEDSVYILGDFMIKGDVTQANQLLGSLNGKKFMIRGNHDSFLDMQGFDMKLFEWVKKYYKLSYKNYKFVLFHYPILNWEDMYNGAIHLYGHVHTVSQYLQETKKKYADYSYNVSTDCNQFSPVSIIQIIERMNVINS